ARSEDSPGKIRAGRKSAAGTARSRNRIETAARWSCGFDQLQRWCALATSRIDPGESRARVAGEHCLSPFATRDGVELSPEGSRMGKSFERRAPRRERTCRVEFEEE